MSGEWGKRTIDEANPRQNEEHSSQHPRSPKRRATSNPRKDVEKGQQIEISSSSPAAGRGRPNGSQIPKNDNDDVLQKDLQEVLKPLQQLPEGHCLLRYSSHFERGVPRYRTTISSPSRQAKERR